jgi:hypothetical protein
MNADQMFHSWNNNGPAQGVRRRGQEILAQPARFCGAPYSRPCGWQLAEVIL